MASLYGRLWIDYLAEVPIEAVQEEWQNGLKGFSRKVVFDAVDYCRENGIDYPPTLPKFRNICKSLTPYRDQQKLPRKFTDEEIEANQERMTEITTNIKKNQVGRDWAGYWNGLIDNQKNYPSVTAEIAYKALEKLGKPRYERNEV